MKDSTKLGGILVLGLLLGAAPLRAQDEPEKKRDPEVAEKVDAFEKAISDKKMERDGEAVTLIDELLQKHQAGMHEKDQADVLKALDRVFAVRPRKPEQPALYRAAVAALGEIGGPVASRVLVKNVEKKPFDDEEWLALQESMYEAIGKAHDPKQIDFLVETAIRDPVDGVQRAAAKALRHFEDLELPERQEIFKELSKYYAKVEGDSKSSLDTGDTNVATAQRKLAAIADAFNTTLTALSGQQLRTAEEWQRWWNKNKDDRKAWK